MKQTIRMYVAATVCMLGVMPMVADGQEIRIVPYDPVTMSYSISPEQAVASARAWFGDPQLQLTLVGVEQQDGWPNFDEYVLESAVHRFKVRCADGHVRSWRDRQATTAWTQATNNGMTPSLSQAQMEQVATAFAASHYPGFASRKMRLLDMEEGTATFVGELAGGVLFAGDTCKLAVCEFTGAVKEYLAHTADQPTVSTVAAVTSAQAETAAMNFLLGSPDVLSAITVSPTALWVVSDDLGVQRLMWLVQAATGPDPNMTYAEWQAEEWRFHREDVFVDAHTAEAVERIPYLGSTAPRPAPMGWTSRSATRANRSQPRTKASPIALSIRSVHLAGLFYPPIVDRGGPALYAGYLRTRHWKAQVAWRHRALHIMLSDGRKAAMRPGEGCIVIDGTAYALKMPMRVYRSRAYLPLDAWEILTGWRCRWLPESRTVSLDPPAPNTAMATGRP